MEKLDKIGRLLQYTGQMDMLMQDEQSIESVAKSFLDGDYNFSG
jgi:pyruvate,water dikinase